MIETIKINVPVNKLNLFIYQYVGPTEYGLHIDSCQFQSNNIINSANVFTFFSLLSTVDN